MGKQTNTSGDDRGASTDGGALKPYVVLARKYRPQTFDDLIGQSAMVTTLRNAFRTGRIAQAYMLTGVRGVGKTTTARILARALNYETEAIDQPTVDMPVLGRHCAEIIESRHADVVEIDAASNTGIDNIREIIESARYKPILARMKVFIVDEVHMLSKGAFNALLKTLEEPPGHVKFIFATTEIRKVPVTVLSRCQRFDLRRVGMGELAEHFARICTAEGAEASDDALALIARAAGGSVRDGLSILDQAIATGSGKVAAGDVRAMLGLADRGRIFDLLELLLSGDAKSALDATDALYLDGADPLQILSDTAEAVHFVSRIKAAGSAGAAEGHARDEIARAQALAGRLTMAILARAWQMLVKGLDEAGRTGDTKAAAEMVLIRLAYTADLPTPDDAIKMLGGVPAARANTARTVNSPPPTAAAMMSAVVQPVASAAAGAVVEDGAVDIDDGDEASDVVADDAMEIGAAPSQYVRQPTSFADVIALAGEKRDALLKLALEDKVSLVKFDARAASIDLFLMPGAQPALANDLREKLSAWTGRRWVVMLSRQHGERPIGEVRREREAAELEALKAHPAVKAVLDVFPDATITAVRPLPGLKNDPNIDEDSGAATG